MKKFHCECEFPDCELMLEETDWYKGLLVMDGTTRNYLAILHPDCKYIQKYKLIKETKNYVVVKYK